MNGVIRENDTFFGIIAGAVALAAKEGKVSEKKIESALGVRRPTAAKVMCALAVMNLLGEKHGKKSLYAGAPDEAERVLRRKDEFAQDYLPLVEEDKAFREIGAEKYMTGTLLPAIKIGILYGSLSVVFLERKMSVAYERAHEIFDIIAACGLLGEEDDINPGRRKMLMTFADYDSLYRRVGAEA